jgi:hypothetical protein
MSETAIRGRGHPDPTADTAIANLMWEQRHERRRFRPLVYVCSPYAGDVSENVRRARNYCRFAVGKGYIPLAPHLLYPQFMDDADALQRRLALAFALVLLCKCEELWVFGDIVSGGMAEEIEKAKRRGVPIRYFNSNCKEVSSNGNQTEQALACPEQL